MSDCIAKAALGRALPRRLGKKMPSVKGIRRLGSQSPKLLWICARPEGPNHVLSSPRTEALVHPPTHQWGVRSWYRALVTKRDSRTCPSEGRESP